MAHYERGIALMKDSDDVKAALEFKSALQLNEKLPGAWYALAQIEQRQNRWQSVVPLLQKVIDLEPKHTQANVELGRLFLLAGEYDQAMKHATTAVESDQNSPEVYSLRSAILLKLGDVDGAKTEAEKALAIDKKNADALGVLAAERLAASDFKGAMVFIDHGLAADPKNLGLLMFRLKVQEDSKDTLGIEDTLKRLTSFYPEEINFSRGLVQHLVNLGRTEEAERFLRSAAAGKPGDVDRSLDLVRFAKAWKGNEAARSELEGFVLSSGGAIEFVAALVELDLSEGKSDVAAQRLENAIAAGGDKAKLHKLKLLLAEVEFGRKATDKAEALVSDVLNEDGRNTDALALRAAMRIEGGKLDEAIADLRQALDDQPKSARLILLMAKAYERKGSVELAIERYAEAVNLSEFAPDPSAAYVSVLMTRGTLDRAGDVLTRSLERSPGNARLLGLLAQVRLRQQDWAGAEKAANALKQSGDKSGLADQILGTALAAQNKYDKSLAALQAAFDAAPGSLAPMYALVNVYVRANQLSEAEAFLRSLLNVNPKNADAEALLGFLQQLQNAPDKAKGHFEAAIAHKPNQSVGYGRLASLYAAQKDPQRAIATLEQGIDQVDRDADLRMQLGVTLEVNGEIDKAIAQYKAIVDEDPDAYVAINNLASLLSDYKTAPEDLDQAYAFAQRLKDFDVPQFKDTLGWISVQRGQVQQGIALLEEAKDAIPNMPLIRYHLGVGYAKAGKKTQAAEQFTKAIELLGQSDPLRARIVAANEELNKISSP